MYFFSEGENIELLVWWKSLNDTCIYCCEGDNCNKNVLPPSYSLFQLSLNHSERTRINLNLFISMLTILLTFFGY